MNKLIENLESLLYYSYILYNKDKLKEKDFLSIRDSLNNISRRLGLEWYSKGFMM